MEKGERVAKLLLLDEFHVTVYVKRGLRAAVCASMRRALDSATFQRELRRDVRTALGRYPELRKTRVTITR